ncbi:MAG: hypothetical protein ACLGIS_10950 [Actinomycetes bacterium]
MPLPSRPDSEVSVQSVIFDRDAIVITYAETADVHLAKGQPLIHTHTLTIAESAGLDVAGLHEDLVDFLHSARELFDDSPAVLDAQDSDEESDDGSDPYAGLGE